MVDEDIRTSYKLLVFPDATAAATFITSRIAEPVLILTRLSNGRLLEFAIDPTAVQLELSEADRDHLPPASSAVVLTHEALHAMDLGALPWEHVIYPINGSVE